jgi:hypothetical protein
MAAQGRLDSQAFAAMAANPEAFAAMASHPQAFAALANNPAALAAFARNASAFAALGRNPAFHSLAMNASFNAALQSGALAKAMNTQ